MDERIVEWSDSLAAPLSTSAERQTTLDQIEHFLASICCQQAAQSSQTLALPLLQLHPTTRAAFWQLQGLAGFNLAESLLHHLARLHILLQQELALFQLSQGLRTDKAATYSHTERDRVASLVHEACTALTLLQGLALSHRSTKRICQRKCWMELLLSITLSDYSTDLVPSMLSGAVEGAKGCVISSSGSGSAAPFVSLPSVFALEMLMCILVESKQAQATFSDIGGLQQIVQLSHRCGEAVSAALDIGQQHQGGSSSRQQLSPYQLDALKQTDLHCLEFRYFVGQLEKGGEVQPHDLDFTGGSSTGDRSDKTATDQSDTTSSKRTISVVHPRQVASRSSSPASDSSTSTVRDQILTSSIRDDGPSSISRGRRAKYSGSPPSEEDPPRKRRQEAAAADSQRAVAEDQQTPRAVRKRASISFAPVASTSPSTSQTQNREYFRRVQSGHVAAVSTEAAISSSERRHRLRPTKSVAELRSEATGRGRSSVAPASIPQRAERLARSSQSVRRDRRAEGVDVEQVAAGLSSPTKRSSPVPSPIPTTSVTSTTPPLHLPKIKGTGVTRSTGSGPGIVARLEAREQSAASSIVRFAVVEDVQTTPRRRPISGATPPIPLAPRQAPSNPPTSPLKPARSSSHLIGGEHTTLLESPKPFSRHPDQSDTISRRRGGEDRENETPPSVFATMNRRVPPSPAVRRAQMARARSLSPQKPYRVREAFRGGLDEAANE